MRLEALTVRGIGPIRSELHVDFGAVPGPIVAVHGENGVGKTTLFECYAGAVSSKMKMPSRGLLKHMSVARDSLVEATVVNGRRYRIRHAIDCVSGNGSSVVIGDDGEPVYESSGVSAFKEWASTHMPSPDVFLASVFAAQGKASLIDALDGDRKALLLRSLGLERYERLAKQARDRATASTNQLTTIAARIDELGGVDVAQAETAVSGAESDAELANQALGGGRTELDQARAQVAEAQRVEERNAEKRRQRADLAARLDKAELDITAAEAQLGRARTEVSDLDTKIRNNRGLLEHRDAIEASVQRRAELDSEIASASEQLLALGTEAESLRKEQARLDREIAAATKRAAQHRQRAERLRQDVGRAAKAEAAAQALPERRKELDAAKAALTEAEAALEELRSKRLAGAEERIDGLRGALVQIGEAEEEHRGESAQATVLASVARLARHTIQADDDAVELAASLPKAIQAAQERVSAARGQVGDAEVALRACTELAAIADRAEADRQALAEAEEQIAAEEQAATDHRRQVEERKANLLRVGDRRDATDRQLVKLQDEHAGLAELVAKAPHLAVAEQRIADRTAQREQALERVRDAEGRVEQARAAHDELRVQLSATPEPEASPSAPTAREVAALEEQVGRRERASRDAHAAVSVAEKALEDARGAAARAAELEEEKRQIEGHVADWKRLAADLGRDGLQAQEIDCAGPELTELTNDLLHRCVGPRYSVRVETTKLDSKGKRELEGLPITAIDTENGYEGDVRGFSGGQRVLLGEALSLALTMLVARRAGLEGLTIVRDETGAALSPENSRAYISMLRRAASIVSADKILLVSHNPDVWDLADSRLEVRDGTVLVH